MSEVTQTDSVGGGRTLRARTSSRFAMVGALLVAIGCSRAPATREAGAQSATRSPAAPAAETASETRAAGPAPSGRVGTGATGASATPASTNPLPAAKPALVRERYAWLASAAEYPPPVEPLAARFPNPEGFHRVTVEPGSFGEWLRGLPLAAAGTPVRTYRGTVRYASDDRRIAAVVAIDVGKTDLQQCADSVMRLHGEWAWAQGRRDQSYQAAAGMPLTYQRFARGERIATDGNRLRWQPGRPPAAGHSGFREFMNMVFSWSNTVSLSRQAQVVASSDVRPGDFFVLPGNPGHTVLILDMVRDGDGHTLALIGQSYMPAQSFYVLRGDQNPWFTLRPGQPVDTPFWEPFPWDALRRLDS